ncbi:hypothetical protein B0I21_11347 [Sphingobacterium paludis]|uniref:Uncharacterized protein n=1 Tax=Sphingobacterium paludis TaxID=1476465 RepID=A0A4R7CSF1_9SPHI|nr:hypothetical protein B0I21_11347 [Sphingobacterium paludis]
MYKIVYQGFDFDLPLMDTKLSSGLLMRIGLEYRSR